MGDRTSTRESQREALACATPPTAEPASKATHNSTRRSTVEFFAADHGHSCTRRRTGLRRCAGTHRRVRNLRAEHGRGGWALGGDSCEDLFRDDPAGVATIAQPRLALLVCGRRRCFGRALRVAAVPGPTPPGAPGAIAEADEAVEAQRDEQDEV